MSNLKKLTLLHSNDLHGDFMCECVDDKLVGGASRLSGYVNKVRREEKNVIYAIAGDMFRGSVIDSEFKGISTIEIMNMLSPDIVTIGNHEVDYGIAHLLFIEKCAKFPIINANLYIKINDARLFMPCHIIEKDGMKILFIGIITEEIIAHARQDEVIGSFIDTEEAARAVGKICNAHKKSDIDLTVLLTHIGFEEDKRLARMINPDWGVDVIIGGHSHTFLEKPVTVNNVLIAQAGTGTDFVGRFDIVIDTEENRVDSYEWQCVPINEETCERDEQLERVIGKYKEQTDAKYSKVLTRFKNTLTHPQRNMETSLGNLFADIFKESLGLDIMLLGSGSIRGKALGPIVDLGSLSEVFPYDDGVHMFKITGDMLRRIVLHLLRDEAFLDHTEFYQFSEGVEITYSKADRKIEKLEYRGIPVEDDHIFTVGMQEFHFNNLEDFLNIPMSEIEAIQRPRCVSTSCVDILTEYMNDHPLLDSEVAGRVRVI